MASSKMKWRNWSTEKIIGTQFEAFVYNLFIKQSRMVDWNINYYSKNKIAPVDLVEKKSLTDMVLDNLLPFNLQKGNIYSATDSEEKFGNKNLLLYELKYSSSKKIDINKRGNPVNQLLGYCKITGFKPGGIITNTGYTNKLISYERFDHDSSQILCICKYCLFSKVSCLST